MGRALILKCLLTIVGLLSTLVGSMAIGDQNQENAGALMEFYTNISPKSALLDNWGPVENVCSWGGVTCDPSQNVVKLNLSAQLKGGFIGTSLGRLTKLEELYLDQNVLTGNIPAALGNLTSLSMLSLYDNELVGPIPPQLGNCSLLQNLWLQQNHLSGTIPESLGNLDVLGSVLLADNSLTGEVPLSFGSLTSLQQLDLGGNSLFGNLPGAIFFKNTKLVQITVSNNQLTGDITSGMPSFECLLNRDSCAIQKRTAMASKHIAFCMCDV